MGGIRKASRFHYAFLIVVACVALTGIPGAMTMNCAGLFFTPVSDYFGVPKAQFTLYFSILHITAMIAMPFAGALLGRGNIRYLLSGAVVLIGLSFAAMSQFNAVWMFYITGVTLGVGLAPVLFLATPLLIDRWCRKNVGLFVGIGMAATGIGGVLFNPLGTAICASAPDGWRMAYLVFAALILLVALPVVFFVVRSDPSDLGLAPYGWTEEPAGEGASSPRETSTPRNPSDSWGVSASKAVRTSAFVALAAFSFVLSLNQTTYQFFASYCQASSSANVVAAAGIVAAACMAGQAIGKVALGSLSDKSPRAGLLIGVLCGMVGLLLMMAAGSNVVIMMAGSFLYGGLYSCNAVHAPLLIRAVFGSRDYSKINSYRTVFATMSFAFGAELWGMIADMPNGYTAMFALSIALAALCGALGLFVCSKIGKYNGLATQVDLR